MTPAQLVDPSTGRPVSLDYGFTTTRTTGPGGTIATVRVPFARAQVPASVRAYLMVDTRIPLPGPTSRSRRPERSGVDPPR